MGQAVEVRDRERVDRAGDRERVAGGDGVERADPEPALPPGVGVVGLGEAGAKRGVVGDERPGAVAGEIGAEDADAGAPAVVAGLVEQRVGVGERGGAPGGVGVEAEPLVEQNTLRGLEEDRAGRGEHCVDSAVVDQGDASCKVRVIIHGGVDPTRVGQSAE